MGNQKVYPTTKELSQSSILHKAIFPIMENFEGGFIAIDKKWRYLYLNSCALDNLNSGGFNNFKLKDLIGKNIWKKFPRIVGTKIEKNLRKVMTQKISLHFEDNGVERTDQWYENHIYPIPEGIAVSWVNITERKRSEKTAKELRERTFAIMENFEGGFVAIDKNWRYLYANNYAVKGLTNGREKPEDLVGKNIWEKFPRTFGTEIEKNFRKVMNERITLSLEIKGIETDQWYKNHIYPIPEGIAISWVNITKQKKNEANLYKLNRTLKALNKSGQELIRATNELDYLKTVCKIIIKDCGYKMIWIGFTEEDQNKTVRPVASAGFEKGYLKKLKITWADTEHGRGPTGTAIRTGKIQSCKNIQIDPLFKPWRAEAIKRGYKSSLVIPLIDKGTEKKGEPAFGAINIYSETPDAFLEDEIKLLTELADDLAHGILSIRTRLAREAAEENLRIFGERLELSQQALAAGTWDWDIIKDQINWSPQMFDLFGLNHNNTPSFELWRSILHPEDKKTAEAKIKKSLKNHTALNNEYRVVLPSGHVKWISAVGKGIYDKNNQPIRMVGLCMDISERKNTELRLTYLASFPKLNPNPIIELKSTGEIIYQNPKAKKLLLGLKKLRKKHPYLIKWDKIVDFFKNKNTDYFTRDIQIKNFWFEQVISYLPETRNFRIYGREITRRKEIEKKLIDFKRDLLRAQTVAHIGDWHLDIKKDKLFWSEEAYRIFGLSPKIEITYKKFIDCIHPNDRQYVNRNWKLMTKGKLYDIEHRIIVNNKIKWIREKAELDFDRNGRLISSFGVFHDITEQKEFQEKLKNRNEKLLANSKKIERLSVELEKINIEKIRILSQINKRIVDNAPISILNIDKNGDIIFANKYYLENLTSDADDPLGKNIFKKLFFIKEGLVENYKKLLSRGISFTKEKCCTKNLKGEVRYINIIAVPIRNRNRKVESALSIGLDVTNAVLAEKELEQINIKLEDKVLERTKQLKEVNEALNQSLEAKGRFVSDASHELRTPLTIMQMNLHLAKKELEDRHKELPKVFKSIEQEVNKIAVILTDLSFLTKMEGVQEKISINDVNLNKLIYSTIQNLKILADERNIKIIWKKTDNDLIIRGDELKLEKLISNLIRNAIKYNKEKGQIKVWLALNLTNKMVSVNISDTGIGISKKDLPYLYQRFYRTEESRKAGIGGFGLGLAICKWIVDQHQGTISVQSRLGKGSLFSVSLPINLEKK